MFSILSYFRRPAGDAKAGSSVGKREKEKKARSVSKERNAAPTLSGFVDAAARGGVSSSTAGNYRTAVRSFVRFNSGRDVPLSALNAETLRRYERWLHE
ncbi:phage integrase SAM-like domain-containing protein, partial [Bacteroides sp. KG68]|uniref:phage integrase SAM-like domain-containing protein n=1 Tax=Bacteroides sp. KG68 TaxID=3397824 RepID=UPI003D95E4FD